MTLNPNKYKASFAEVGRQWERGQAKEDFEYIISEIAVSTGIEIAAVCMILEYLYKDIRIDPIKQKLVKFYKYDVIIEIV